MDEKKIKDELDEICGRLCELWEYVDVLRMNEENQKSKKTEKKKVKLKCRFRVLYATHKYGCSGFPDEDECLICEMRRYSSV